MKRTFKALSVIAATMLTGTLAFAEETVASIATGSTGYMALAAGFGLAIAVFGGAVAQGKIGAAAMEGIARNPNAQKNMFIPMILGLALVESLVIYMLVISFILQGKI